MRLRSASAKMGECGFGSALGKRWALKEALRKQPYVTNHSGKV